MSVEWSFQQMVPVQLNGHMQKSEAVTLPYTIYKNYLKMNQRPKHESWHYVTLSRKIGVNIHNFGFDND